MAKRFLYEDSWAREKQTTPLHPRRLKPATTHRAQVEKRSGLGGAVRVAIYYPPLFNCQHTSEARSQNSSSGLVGRKA